MCEGGNDGVEIACMYVAVAMVTNRDSHQWIMVFEVLDCKI